MEAFGRLFLTENVEVAAGTKLRQQTEPFRRINGCVERGEERMVEGLENLSLRLGSAFFAPARELLLVHDLGGQERQFDGGCGFELG